MNNAIQAKKMMIKKEMNMRITARISGAGKEGLSKIPWVSVDSIDDELCTNGHLDESKIRSYLKDAEGIQLSANDCIPTLAFGCELMNQTYKACKSMINNRKELHHAHQEAETKDDQHAERNMRKGRFLYVRADITYSNVSETITLKISINNPKGVVGVANNIAKDYAYVLARIANHIADELTASKGSWKYSFIGGNDCEHLFDEARTIEENLDTRRANEQRMFCNRRTAGGFCSPCNFECPHCANGMCVELKEKKL